MKIPPKKPHFFKPILPGFINGVTIPESFFRFLGERKHLDNQMAVLRGPGGKEWRVKITDQFLREGWSEFAAENNLEPGDIAVFRHQGNMVFDVLIFDLSRCEKEYHSASCKNNGRDVNESHSPEESAVGIPYFISTIKPYCVRWSYLNLPMGFSRSNGLANRRCEIILKDEGQRSWHLNLTPNNPNGVRIRNGHTLSEFFAANGFKEGDSFKFELAQNGETPVVRILPHLAAETKSGPTSSARKTNGQDKGKRRKATSPEFDSGRHPYFISTILPSYIKGALLNIPMNFARSNGLLMKGKMILIDKRQRSWPVRLRHDGSGHYRICCGWAKFRNENGLKKGDTVKFELVQNGRVPVARVTALRRTTGGVPAPPVAVGSKKRRV